MICGQWSEDSEPERTKRDGSNSGRQYYVDSHIEGGVDFIFGNATAVFDRDEIHSNGPG